MLKRNNKDTDMTALNRKPKAVAPITKMSLSGNGNLQYLKSDKLMLIEIATSVLYGKDQFYNSSDALYKNALAAISNLVSTNQFDYIANTCLFSRKVMDMRSYPIAIVVEFANALAKQNKHYANMRSLVRDVITRADELTELYGYALKVFGDKKCIPLAIKKGVADAFNKFDAYQLGKYNGGSKSIAFKDLLRIVHPTPCDELHSDIFRKIMQENLETPYTWETEFSKNGQLHVLEQKSKGQIWKELIDSNSLGYMAMLRNLRNIEQECDDVTVHKVAVFIANPTQVARSKQFPYSFVTANSNVTSSIFKNATDEALKLSCANIPNLGDKVCIIVDASGSMHGNAALQANIFASSIIAAHQDSSVVDVVFFANRAALLPNRKDLTTRTEFALALARSGIGGGTDFSSALTAIANKKYDAVFILSDGDVNPMDLKKANESQRDAYKIIFNFNASPTTPIREKNAFFLCGLSGKIFQYLKYVKNLDGIVSLVDVPYGKYAGN